MWLISSSVGKKVVNKASEKEKLEKEIINLVKKKLIKLMNEYDILNSDLYVLEELLNDDVYYKKCKENVEEIKKLLTKINPLIFLQLL